MPKRILVVDDEPSITSLLSRVLVRDGYEVILATNGQQALEMAAKEKPDLIVLDLNLPDLYGEDVCARIRQNPVIEKVPVLILTGKTTQGLSARCLNGGADDYLPKPFDIEDILAHLKALLRRVPSTAPGHGDITNGRITIRVPERMVLWKGQRLETLAPKEFELLRHLVFHAPKVLDKNMLALSVWGAPIEQLHDRTLDVHVRRIRKKLGPSAAACLKTVPAVGFQWLDSTVSPLLAPASSR